VRWLISSQATRLWPTPGSALTLPSSGRSTAGFAVCCPPLMSNVRRTRMLQSAGLVLPPHAQARMGRPSAGGRRTDGCSGESLAPRLGRAQFRGLASSMQRSCFSLALRSTAAPGRKVGGGTGFARAATVGPLRHQCVSKVGFGSARSTVARVRRPNPSVKRTSNGGWRWLVLPPSATPLAAAYLKR
jgi:hypothetical protein